MSGSGETCDVSSQSLRFTPDTPLPAKALIELSIDWPATTNQGDPIHLAVFGTILRCNSRGVVVLIGRYSFRPPPGGPPLIDTSHTFNGAHEA